MKEYVSKWNASQKEVDANTQQQDELTEVEVPGKLKASLNEVDANTKQEDELAEADGKVDDSKNVDDSENEEDEVEDDEDDVEFSNYIFCGRYKGFFLCVLCDDEFTEHEVYEHCCEEENYIQGRIIKENFIQCKDCEYSTSTFHNLGRHTYENHKVGGKDYKENVVDMSSVSVKTELRPEECKHSKKLNEEQVKEELVEKKEVTVQTETELKKCNDCEFCTDELQKHIRGEKCKENIKEEMVKVETKEATVQTEPEQKKCNDREFCTDDLNELLKHTQEEKCKEDNKIAVSVKPVERELKNGLQCYDCSETFQTRRDLMTHRKATHKEKVNLCKKFVARLYCIFGSEACWYVHKEREVKIIGTEFECNQCRKVFRALPDLMRHNKQEHNENIASCYKEASGNCMFGPNSCWFSHIKSVSNNRQKEKRFKCRTCEQIFNLKPVLMKHRKQEHNAKVESCYKAASETCSFEKESCWFNH